MAGNVASFFLGQVDATALTLENIAHFTFKRPGTPATVFCFMLAHGMKVEIFGRTLPKMNRICPSSPLWKHLDDGGFQREPALCAISSVCCKDWVPAQL
jgi:hypothetical protein